MTDHHSSPTTIFPSLILHVQVYDKEKDSVPPIQSQGRGEPYWMLKMYSIELICCNALDI